MFGILAFEMDDGEIVAVDAVSTDATEPPELIELAESEKADPDDVELPEGREGYNALQTVGVAYTSHWRSSDDSSLTPLVEVVMHYDYNSDDGFVVNHWWTRDVGEITPPKTSDE